MGFFTVSVELKGGPLPANVGSTLVLVLCGLAQNEHQGKVYSTSLSHTSVECGVQCTCVCVCVCV